MPARASTAARLPPLGDPDGAASMWVWTARRGQVRRLLRRPGSADGLLPQRGVPLADWWQQLPPSLALALRQAWQRLHCGARQTRFHWQAGANDTGPGQTLVDTAWLWQLEAWHGPNGRLLEVSGWICPAANTAPAPQSAAIKAAADTAGADGAAHPGSQAQPAPQAHDGPASASTKPAVQRRQLAEISHELRTPLNAILGFSALAQQTPDQPESVRPALRQIEQAAQLMRQVVDDLLDLERLDAGALSLGPPQAVSVSGLLSRVLALASGLPMRPEVALHAQLAADVPPAVLADSQRLTQVLLNLVANALRHTDSGLVQVAVRLRQGVRPRARPGPSSAAGAPAGSRMLTLRWSVSDTGVGMGLGDLNRLTQPQAFGQVGDDLQRRRGGSGLGLVVVQRLLALHGSRLQVASMPGGGTTVWFDLDLCQAPSTPDSADAAEAPGADGSPDGSDAPERRPTPANRLPCTALLCTRDPRLAATLAVQWQAQGQRLANHSPDELARLAGVQLGEVAHWLVDSRLPADTQQTLQTAAQASGVRLWAVDAWPISPEPAQANDAAEAPALPRLYAPLAGRSLLAPAPAGLATPVTQTSQALPVLVVEDNLLNQRVFQSQLARLGLRCQVAGSLAEARRLCRTHSYAAALLDRELPDGEGLDLLHDWQQRPAAQHWPVLVTSAHFEPEHQAQAQRLGALGCLLKPVQAEQLQALLLQAGVLTAAQGTPSPGQDPGRGRRLSDAGLPGTTPDLMPLFLRERAALLAPVEAAWAAGDRVTLGRAVHALHGALALLPPQQGGAALAVLQRVVQGLQQPEQPPLPSLPVPALVQAVRAMQSVLA